MDFRACVSLHTVEQLVAAAPQHAAWSRVDVDVHDLLDMIDDDVLEAHGDSDDSESVASSY